MTEPIAPTSKTSGITQTGGVQDTEGANSGIPGLTNEAAVNLAKKTDEVHSKTRPAVTPGGNNSLKQPGVTIAKRGIGGPTEEVAAERPPLKGQLPKKGKTKIKLSPEQKAARNAAAKTAGEAAGAAKKAARQTFREEIAKELEKMDQEGGLSETIVGQEFIKEAERSTGSFAIEVPPQEVKDASSTKEESEVETPQSTPAEFSVRKDNSTGTSGKIEDKSSSSKDTKKSGVPTTQDVINTNAKVSQKDKDKRAASKITDAELQAAKLKLKKGDTIFSKELDKKSDQI